MILKTQLGQRMIRDSSLHFQLLLQLLLHSLLHSLPRSALEKGQRSKERKKKKKKGRELQTKWKLNARRWEEKEWRKEDEGEEKNWQEG